MSGFSIFYRGCKQPNLSTEKALAFLTAKLQNPPHPTKLKLAKQNKTRIIWSVGNKALFLPNKMLSYLINSINQINSLIVTTTLELESETL